jgi:hypothetical protein
MPKLKLPGLVLTEDGDQCELCRASSNLVEKHSARANMINLSSNTKQALTECQIQGS